MFNYPDEPTLSEAAVTELMKRLGPPVRVMEDGAEKPCWQLKLVEVREEEIAGLDRMGFRDLVRRKLQEVGDDLLVAWEARDGG
jgi:hypothetical protein